MTAWQIAIKNLAQTIGRYTEAGRCAWCGTPLGKERRRFCSTLCTVKFNNMNRATTREGRARV